MTPERWRQIENLFHQAREQPPGEREAFLAAACAGDQDLKGKVESLLARDVAGTGMLDRPPWKVPESPPQSQWCTG